MVEEKEKPTHTQSSNLTNGELDTLHGVIAPKEIFQSKDEDDEGSEFATIREATNIDTGTKILFLERAITLPPTAFHRYLDTLDVSYITQEEERSAHINLIHSFQMINDFYWNTPSSIGEKPILNSYFSGYSKSCTLKDCQDEITRVIQIGINSLKGSDGEWAKQREQRLKVESTTPPKDFKEFVGGPIGTQLDQYAQDGEKEGLLAFGYKYHKTISALINNQTVTQAPPEIAELCVYICRHRDTIKTLLLKGSGGWEARLTIADILLLEYRKPGSFQKTLDYYLGNQSEKSEFYDSIVRFPQLYEAYVATPEDFKIAPLINPSSTVTTAKEDSKSYGLSEVELTKEEEEELAKLTAGINTPLADLEKPKAPMPRHKYSFFKKPSPQQIAEAAVVSFLSGVGQITSLGFMLWLNKDWVTTAPKDASSIGNMMNNAAVVYGVTTLITLIVVAGILSVRREVQDADHPAAHAQPT